MADDVDLLREYSKAGSEAAFRRLVDRYFNLVYFAALRQVGGDGHRAEDVAQEVFTVLARMAPELFRHPTLAGWLYTTTRHKAANAAQADRRRKLHEQEAAVSRQSAEEPEERLEWERLRPVIDEVLDGLNPREREVVLLRYFQNSPFAEIGARLGLSADAARFRVDRALEKIRRLLARKKVTSTTAALALALGAQTTIAAPVGAASRVAGGALIQAAAGGLSTAPSLSLLQFMTTTKMSLGAAAILGALMIGLNVHEAGTRQREENALTEATAKFEGEFKDLEELRRRANTARESQAGLERSLADLKAKQATTGATQSRAADAARPSQNGGPTKLNRPFNNDPQIRKSMATWVKDLMASQYDQFFKSAGVSPEVRDQILDLLAERGTHSIGDVRVNLRPDSVSSQDIDESIQNLLGDPNTGQLFQEYARTVNVREAATALAGNLYTTGTPLTAAQADALTQVIANNSPQYQAGHAADPDSVNWDTAVSQAQSVLSPQQLAVFRNVATLISLGTPGYAGTAGDFGQHARDTPLYSPEGP